MATAFQQNAFQNNAFQIVTGGPPSRAPSIWDISSIYIRDEWRTVLRVFNYTVLLGILLGM